MSAYTSSGDHVAAEVVDDELIIMNMSTGSYYSALASGKSLWYLLISGADAEDVFAVMAHRAADSASFVSAARAMLHLLCEDGLIVATSPSRQLTDADVLAVAGDVPMAPPEIEVHRDMEDILMLDPIHDVGEAGWPVRPGAV